MLWNVTVFLCFDILRCFTHPWVVCLYIHFIFWSVMIPCFRSVLMGDTIQLPSFCSRKRWFGAIFFITRRQVFHIALDGFGTLGHADRDRDGLSASFFIHAGWICFPSAVAMSEIRVTCRYRRTRLATWIAWFESSRAMIASMMKLSFMR